MYLRFFCLLSNLIFQFRHNAAKSAIRFGYYDQTAKRHPFLGAFGYLFTVFNCLYSIFNWEHKVELGLLLYSNCFGTVLRICKFFSFLRYEPPSAQKFWISSKNCLPYRSALALPTPPTARSCAMVAGRRTAISRRVLSLNTI